METKIMKNLFKNRMRLNQHGFDHMVMIMAFVVVIGVVGAGLVVVKGHKTIGVSHAAASWSNQFCISGKYCLNAWYGGPDVMSYSGGVVNNDFYSYSLANGHATYLMYAGNSKYYGYCIGDAYNDSTVGYAQLIGCPNNSISGGGWGTHFHVYTCSANGYVGYAFKNDHWTQVKGRDEWMVPYEWGNGYRFYLNSSSEYCFSKYAAVL